MSEHSPPNIKVVVVGGGYAGAVAANRLRMRGDVDIALVNPRPRFVDRVRLHEFVAGTGEAEVDYGTLLGDEVRLVVDVVTRIDTAARTVELASGRAMEYGYVIYAVGSTGATPSVPGAAEFAFSVAEFEFARRLRARLKQMPLDAPVTVVGGGLTGIETAAELAEHGRAVTLGRLLTDEMLTSVDDDRVVAAGGAAAPSGQPLRMSSYAAGPLGAQAADTVLSRIAGTEPAVLSVAFRGRASAWAGAGPSANSPARTTAR